MGGRFGGNGGIAIDPDGAVKGIPNLYAIGAVTGGVHGRNRLMGNSLLDIVVFGRRAGRRVAEYLGGEGAVQDTGAAKLSLEHVHRYNAELEAAGCSVERGTDVLHIEAADNEAKLEFLDETGTVTAGISVARTLPRKTGQLKRPLQHMKAERK